jgi:hypothetical protein
MERNDSEVIEAIKTKLNDLSKEIDRDYRSDFSAHFDQVAEVASRETVESQINSFLEMVAQHVSRKARSMGMRAFEILSDVKANGNVQKGVKEFILACLDSSDNSPYVKDCKWFIGVADKHDQERIAKWQRRLRYRVANTLRDAGRTVEVNFTLFSERINHGSGTPDPYTWLFPEPIGSPGETKRSEVEALGKAHEVPSLLSKAVDKSALQEQGIEPKQIGQGTPAEDVVKKVETAGQAERTNTTDAEDPEPGREPVFFRSRIAKTLGLISPSNERAGETLRKTLEQDYDFPVHFDKKGNRWNYRDEIDTWGANHAGEIATLNGRKRKPKEQKKKK